MSDKYTRKLDDYENQAWPGKPLPEYFNHGTHSDGYRGIQGMIQGAMAAYGAYHVIEGCYPKINGANISGMSGFVMWSGSIIDVNNGGEETLAAGEWYAIDSTGGYFTTGAKPTGVIIAANIGGTVYDVRQNRWDENSKSYFPNRARFYRDIFVYQGATISGSTNLTGDVEITGDQRYQGDVYIDGDVTGTNDLISGYKEIDAKTGVFTNLSGHSDIKSFSSVNFQDTYHVKGVSQFSGAIISGSQITGTSGSIENAKITKLGANLDADSHNINNINNLDVNGSVDIEGSVDINNTLDVHNTVDMNSNLITRMIGQYGFSAYNDGDQTIPNATWTKMELTEDFSHGGLSTANDRYVAPRDGYYYFHAMIMYETLSWNFGESMFIALRVDGVAKRQFIKRFHYNATIHAGIQVDGLLDLDEDDYVEVWVYHNRGGNNDFEPDAMYNRFEGFRVEMI